MPPIFEPRRNQVFRPDGTLESEQVVQVDVTVERNDRTLRDAAAAALVANRTYLAIATPTNAQVAAQVRKLTQQMQGVIRLAADLLDEVD